METNSAKGSIPLRVDIPPEYKWKLELMYANDDLWEADFQEARRLLPQIAELKGALGSAPSALYGALHQRDEILMLMEKLYAYAKMRRDEDNTNEKHQELVDRAQALDTAAGAALSFIVPEILALEKETIEAFLREEQQLAVYRHHLDDITRLSEHILSEREEELLSLAGEVLEGPDNIYTMLSSADLTFPAITDEHGDEVALTRGRYQQFLLSPNRQVRRDAFKGLFSAYNSFKNTFNASLSAEVRKNRFLSRARRYSSARELYLDRDNIPLGVYDNVVETVNRNLAPLHRYVELKKKVLGLEAVHFYDLYVPLAGAEAEKRYSFEEASQIVLDSLQPLGEAYISGVKSGLTGGWIDVYESKGKTTGGYSYGTYTSPPYILLNYTGTIDDVFTLAHELGHSMHSRYSRGEQPFVYSRYTLFSAEVASTTNETLLVRHLLKITPPGERAVIINQYLEGIRATFFRQAMFAEFELAIHRMVEEGEALTADKLCAYWLELNNRYYGDDFAADPLLGIEWARIPHFYYQFYVYKYVTGFAAGTSLGKSIFEDGAETAKRYLAFLTKGSSGYTLDLLKDAGVDMETPAPLEDTISLFDSLVSDLEVSLK